MARKKNIPHGTGGGNGIRTRSQNAERHIRTRYGLSHEQWLEMLNRQKGKCAICGIEFGQTKRICVDHCHETEKVRGLLCDLCNLGMIHIDKEEWMEKALEYKKEGGFVG